MTISKSPLIIDFLRPTSWTKRTICHAANILRTTSTVLKIGTVKESGKGVVSWLFLFPVLNQFFKIYFGFTKPILGSVLDSTG